MDGLQISEEKKNYIIGQVNPVLEEMVAETIRKSPADPMPFMIDWMEKKKATAADMLLTSEDKENMNKENVALEAEIVKARAHLHETAKLAAEDQPAADAEEEEEDDDEDGEPPPGFFDDKPQQKARQSVSAEAYGQWNTKKTFVPPIIPKTDEQKERLKNCLCKSFLFAALDENDLTIVIGAMKEVPAQPKERVIKQGESGDFLFVIESGKLECLIKTPDGTEKNVKTCEPGDVFGELALLYNCPRAASVEASEACILWELDRDTFSNIVSEAAQKKRECYDTFLSKIPLLSTMDFYERGQLTDALKPETFKQGATIVTQGEEGKKFYIIEEGQAIAKKGSEEVMSYNTGDYFGELALIRNQPRAATVICKTDCKVLSVDKSSFKRLLNVSDLLERSTKYK